jgi:hypothetical protein
VCVCTTDFVPQQVSAKIPSEIPSFKKFLIRSILRVPHVRHKKLFNLSMFFFALFIFLILILRVPHVRHQKIFLVSITHKIINYRSFLVL